MSGVYVDPDRRHIITWGAPDAAWETAGDRFYMRESGTHETWIDDTSPGKVVRRPHPLFIHTVAPNPRSRERLAAYMENFRQLHTKIGHEVEAEGDTLVCHTCRTQAMVAVLAGVRGGP